MWSPQPQTMGPPKHIKPRPYHPTLEYLETEANKLCISDYEQDIINYLALVQSQSLINCSMIDLQPEIQWFMRPYLLDFLIEIHQSFRLQPQTLFLSVFIIDTYCSKRVVFKKHYQLVGCTALWLAAKYEDKKSRVPTLKELTIMCRNAYDSDMFVQMEKHILATMEWSLSFTSLEDSLQLSLTSATQYIDETPRKIGDKFHNKKNIADKIQTLSRFLCELSLYERNFLQLPPSTTALACHLLAANILGSDSAAEAFEHAINRYYAANREFDDDETFDEDLENMAPNVVLPFLAGFSDETTDNLAKAVVMLINTFKTCTEALQNKYKNFDNFNYVELLSGFIKKVQPCTQSFPENSHFQNITESQLDSNVNYAAHYLLGLASSPFPETSFMVPPPPHGAPFSTNQAPLTPPSASSTISSIFSTDHYQHNYSNTSLSLTPSTSPMDHQQHKSIFYNSSANNSATMFKKPSSIDHATPQGQPHHLHQVQTQYNHIPPTYTYSHIPAIKRQRGYGTNSNDDKNLEMSNSCPGSSPLAQRSQKMNLYT